MKPPFTDMNKRFLIALIGLLCFAFPATSQILKKVHWTTEMSATEVTVGDEGESIFNATIDPGWYIYSVDFDYDCGPIPMTVAFDNTTGFSLVGSLRAPGDKAKYDKTFGCDVRIFENTGQFRQTVKIRSAEASTISGTFEGQVCSEAEGLCVLYDGDFSFSLNISGGASSAIRQEPVPTREEPAAVQPLEPSVADSATVTEVPSDARPNRGPILDPSILEGEASYGTSSFGALLIVAFLAGFAALITPCVFPMVPMTVTFFLRDNQSRAEGIRKASVFGISIIGIYTIAGTLFAVLLGTDGLNALATHWAPNLFVFVIFIVFAL